MSKMMVALPVIVFGARKIRVEPFYLPAAYVALTSFPCTFSRLPIKHDFSNNLNKMVDKYCGRSRISFTNKQKE